MAWKYGRISENRVPCTHRLYYAGILSYARISLMVKISKPIVVSHSTITSM